MGRGEEDMLMNGTAVRRKLNVCIYGESGSGKSSLGATAPKPVILLSETQGFESVRDACARLNIAVPPVFLVSSRELLGKAVIALSNNHKDPLAQICAELGGDPAQLPYVKPESVVTDSLSDMCDLIWKNLLEQAPPKLARDGLPDTSQRHWQQMSERAGRLITSLRDLPYHMVYLCGLDDREVGDEENKTRWVGPLMPMRKLPAVVMRACNAVGVMRVRRKPKKKDQEAGELEQELERYVQFFGPDYMLTKPLKPLDEREVPDISDWIKRWEASLPAVKAAAQMSYSDVHDDDASSDERDDEGDDERGEDHDSGDHEGGDEGGDEGGSEEPEEPKGPPARAARSVPRAERKPVPDKPKPAPAAQAKTQTRVPRVPRASQQGGAR